MEDGHLKKSLFTPAYNRFLVLFRQARIDSGLTQVEAARRLGRPQSFISKCESGERRVDVVELVEFCRVYGIDPALIVNEIAKRTTPTATKVKRNKTL